MDMIEQAFSSAIFHADRDASLADCITLPTWSRERLLTSGRPACRAGISRRWSISTPRRTASRGRSGTIWCRSVVSDVGYLVGSPW